MNMLKNKNKHHTIILLDNYYNSYLKSTYIPVYMCMIVVIGIYNLIAYFLLLIIIYIYLSTDNNIILYLFI